MKVFSLEKFIDCCIKEGDGTCAKEVIERNPWAVKCNHLTSREINAIGYLTHENWMIELPDPTPSTQSTQESATSQPLPPPTAPKYGDCPVGAVVKIQGIPCRIKARKWCRGCILTGASMDLCYKYACCPYDRNDAKNVSFVRIKRF